MAQQNQQIQNLMYGSKGPEVSELQIRLKQSGLYDGNIDGVYGHKTLKAVKEFQTSAGLKPDGIFGANTNMMFEDWEKNPIRFTLADPNVQARMQQNPLFAQAMNQIASSGGNQADMVAAAHFITKASGGAVKYVNPDGSINGDVFQQMALERLGPYINQSIKYYNSDFTQGVQNERAQYAAQLAAREEDIAKQNAQLQTSQGQNNNVNSGWGQTERNNFYNTANTGLNAMQSGAQTRLSSLARNYENNLGTQALKDTNQNFNITTAGSLGRAGTYAPSGTQTNAYNPMGGMGGRLSAQFATDLQSDADKLRTGSLLQLPKYDQYLAASTYGGNYQNYPSQ